MYFVWYEINNDQGVLLALRKSNECIRPEEDEFFNSMIYPVKPYSLHPRYIKDFETIRGRKIYTRNENKSIIEILIGNISVWLIKKQVFFYKQRNLFVEAMAKIYKTDRELEGYYIMGLTSILYNLDMDETFNVVFLKDEKEIQVSKKKLYYLSSKIILDQMETGEKIYLNLTKEDFDQLFEKINNEQELLAEHSDTLDYLQSYLLYLAINGPRKLVDKICFGK